MTLSFLMRVVAGIVSIITIVDNNNFIMGIPVVIVVLRMVLMV